MKKTVITISSFVITTILYALTVTTFFELDNKRFQFYNIDQELWKEVKKAAIDLGVTATGFS